jgi:hypothetical protein
LRDPKKASSLERWTATISMLLASVISYIDRQTLALLSPTILRNAASGFVILAVAYATDVYSTSHSGFIAGVGAGSWSAAVAALMPVFGHMFDGQRYGVAFLIAGPSPVAGYLGWVWLSSRGEARMS